MPKLFLGTLWVSTGILIPTALFGLFAGVAMLGVSHAVGLASFTVCAAAISAAALALAWQAALRGSLALASLGAAWIASLPSWFFATGYAQAIFGWGR